MLYDFFRTFLSLSLMGSVLAVMIMFVKTLFGAKISARWHYYIWALLLARLVIPFAPQHSLSVFNLFKPLIESAGPQYAIPADEGEIFRFSPVYDTPELITIPVNIGENTMGAGALPATAAGLEVNDIIGLIWFAGMLIMAAALIGANLRFTAGLRRKPRCQDEGTLEILHACRLELGIKRQVSLIFDPRVGAPLLSGLIRPTIVSSRNMMKNLTTEEKRYIFLHELMRLKRMDILINWIMAVIKCVYWFNPILWYACFRMKEDCEYACDESVLSLLKPLEYKLYGHTIINLMNTFGKPVAMTCTTGMAGRKPTIKRRINMIAKFKKKTLAWTLSAIALTLLVGCSAMTGAKIDHPSQPEADAADNLSQNNETKLETGNQDAENGNDEDDSQALPEETAPAAAPEDDDGIALVLWHDFGGGEVEEALQNGQTVVYDDSRAYIAGWAVTSVDTIVELQAAGLIEIAQADMNNLADQAEKTALLGYFTSEDHDLLATLVDRAVRYYVDKLKDKTYTGTYGDGYTWYTAAESLGMIGRPAVPYLIDKLETADDYERSLALYALLLATQQENVRVFSGGEYINVNLDFDTANHPMMVKAANDWWEKHKDSF